jgi:hypothetical protein
LSFWTDFLEQEAKFKQSFQALVERSSKASFAQNFYYWWDGFKVLKFVHFRAQRHPHQSASVAAEILFGKDLEGMDLLNYLKSD